MHACMDGCMYVCTYVCMNEKGCMLSYLSLYVCIMFWWNALGHASPNALDTSFPIVIHVLVGDKLTYNFDGSKLAIPKTWDSFTTVPITKFPAHDMDDIYK